MKCFKLDNLLYKIFIEEVTKTKIKITTTKRMSKTKQTSDISDAGSLLALGNLGLNFNNAKAEEEENKQDQKSKRNLTLYDPVNRLSISIDQGIHGANKERLKQWSNLHHRTASHNSKHGCHNMGAKAYAAYVTNFFKDENLLGDENCDTTISLNPKIKQILDKSPDERTPIEILQTTVTVVSRSDEYNPLNNVAVNQINLDFITPIYDNVKYCNEPQQATPLSLALWDKLSFNKDEPGTVTVTPSSEMRDLEIMDCLTTSDISKNHHVFLSNTYSGILEDGTKIEVGLIKININHINIVTVILIIIAIWI